MIKDFDYKRMDFDLLNDCSTYASYQVGDAGKLYEDRGQKENKIFQQCLNGKIGEWNLYFILKKLGKQVTKPNMVKINNNNKYYEPDIICNDSRLHVKTITLESFNSFGKTFLCEKTDQAVKEPKDNDYYIVMKGLSFFEYELLVAIPCLGITYKKPYSPRLKDKLAVYFN